jgi:flagellum-specific ATP synthase
MSKRQAALRKFLGDCRHVAEVTPAVRASGRLIRVTGMVMEAAGLRLAVGSCCNVELPGGHAVDAEVVGFSDDRLYLMPASDTYGVTPGARIMALEPAVERPRLAEPPRPRRRAADYAKHVPVGSGLLGRVLDSTGRALDGLGPLHPERAVSLHNRPLNPLDRAPISEPLDTGIRAINSLLTVGRGQRMGLFAGSGVGKSVLLGMMARYTSADVIVVGLIGERGREVKEFIETILGQQGLARSVVVAAPADVSPLMRLQGAAYATAIAEHFRDQGKHVLLIMDSLTRYAMAQREIALAIGEPPVTKGYPPSVFAKLPQLVERAGNAGKGGGSITAFYTVLIEGDDAQDPVGDSARAILDGHIMLSRQLADTGHYPAIDIETSVSRAMTSLIDEKHFDHVRRFKQLYSRYQRSRDLISVGAYAAGSDPVLDQAIALYPDMERFLQQGMTEQSPYKQSVSGLVQLLEHAPGTH